MCKIVNAAFLPVPLPFFENEALKTDSPYKRLDEAMRIAAKNIKKSKPHTIVIFSRYRWTLEDAIGISPQPRLQGVLPFCSEKPVVVGAESDLILSKELKKQAYRMGIPLVDILSNLPTISTNDYLLHHSAAIPLYYLQEAGLGNTQIVRLTIGRLSYEEIYTFGRLMQTVAANTNRKVAIIGAANLLSTAETIKGIKNRDANYALMTALADCNPRILNDIGYSNQDVYTLRAAAFIMGTISGTDYAVESHYYENINTTHYGLVQFKMKK